MGLLQLLHAITGAPVIQSLYRASPAIFLAAVGAWLSRCQDDHREFDGSQSFFRRAVQGLSRAGSLRPGHCRRPRLCRWDWQLNLPLLATSQRILFGLAAGALTYAGISVVRDIIYGGENAAASNRGACIWWKARWGHL